MITDDNADRYWMTEALSMAHHAANKGEVPVGAVLIHQGNKIAEGWNQPISRCDPSAHAEIMALREGAKALNNYRLLNTTLYVTLEPCAMCAGAIIHARVQRVVFAASDPRSGAVHSAFNLLQNPQLNHRVEWSRGIFAKEASYLLKDFFGKRR
jgi:tRNA(adenine34) deaminase